MPLSMGMSLAVNILSTIAINRQICVFTTHFYDIRAVSIWQLDVEGDKMALKYFIVCCSFLKQTLDEKRKKRKENAVYEWLVGFIV